MKQGKVVFLDYLRVVATMAIVVVHVSAASWETASVTGVTWNVMNVYNSIVRWAVPIFVMISGSLFLKREVSVKKLYTRNVLRMGIAYLSWSIFYCMVAILGAWINHTDHGMSANTIIVRLMVGSYHMWFIPMIIGLYMSVPILKDIVRTRKTASYFLTLSFIFGLVVPQMVMMTNDFLGGEIASCVNVIDSIISDMKMHLVLGYPFYFVLGHMLDTVDFSKPQRRIIYAMGLLGFGLTIVLNAAVSHKTNMPCETYSSPFMVNVLLQTVAVHTWMRYREYNRPKWNAFVAQLAKYSFGVYLVHVYVIDTLAYYGWSTVCFESVLSVPVVSVPVILISYAISAMIHRIPLLNKWIV